jgi:MFS family permease
MFPEPREQAKAIGIYGFVASGGSALGLLLGGVLTEAISWHWIFLVNVPVGIVVAILARRVVEDRAGIGLDKGADLPGAARITAGVMLGVYTILQVEKEGWTSTQTLGLLAVAVALIAAFVVRQARIETPLMPLRLFRSRNVVGANVAMLLMVVGFFGMFFLGALYMQEILGYDPLEVGLAFLPASVAMGALSLGFAEKLIMGIGPRTTLLIGLATAGVGLLLFSRAPVEATWIVDVAPVMLLIGIGAGLAFPALMTLAMSGVDMQDSGLASGLVNTTVQVAGAVGLAVLATLATDRTDSLRADGESVANALNGGYHLAFLIGAVLIGVAVVASALILKPAPAEEHAGEAAYDAA